MEIAGAMLKIIAAMVLGFVLYKVHILTTETNAVISKMVTYAAAPCMIFSSILSLSADNRSLVYTLLIAGIGLYIFMGIIAFAAACIIAPDKKTRGVYEAVMTFGNSAFIAFPVGEALMGSAGVSYLAILNVHQNIFAYSLGVFQLTKGNDDAMRFSVRKLFNPPNIAALLGILLFLLGVGIPDIVLEPLEFLGQITSPLSMVVIGATIGSYPLRQLFDNYRYYIVAAVKMLFIPFSAFFIAYAIWGASDITSVITIHCSMPTAAIISLIAIMYKADYKTTTSVTGLMDILCVGTIPLVWAVTRLFY